MHIFFKCIFIRTIRNCLFHFCFKDETNIFCMKSMLDFMFCCNINYGDIMF